MSYGTPFRYACFQHNDSIPTAKPLADFLPTLTIKAKDLSTFKKLTNL
jgi:hypothetical protein